MLGSGLKAISNNHLAVFRFVKMKVPNLMKIIRRYTPPEFCAEIMNHENKKIVTEGEILILSGPSGSGKTHARKMIGETFPDAFAFSVSATTRPKRPEEVDGKDYYFLTEAEFDAKFKNGDFLETATVHGYRYGTLKAEVDRLLNLKKRILFDIDVNGHASLRRSKDQRIKGAIFSIFLDLKDLKRQEEKLWERPGITAAEVEKRLSIIERERHRAFEFNKCVVNDYTPEAMARLLKIVRNRFKLK